MMKVRIDDTTYSSYDQPIMVILSAYDKVTIGRMSPEDNAYAVFPHGLPTNEIRNFILLDDDNEEDTEGEE